MLAYIEMMLKGAKFGEDGMPMDHECQGDEVDLMRSFEE